MTIFDPLTTEEVAALSSPGPHATRRYFIPVEPREVFAGEIASTPAYSTEGAYIAELDIENTSGDSADVRKNMDIWIGTEAGLSDVAVLRVRETPTTGTLYIGEYGSGSPGSRTLTHHQKIEAGMHFTVLATFSLWYVFPRIALSGSTGIHYKDFDDAFTDQTIYPPPVVNLGPFRWGFVNESNNLQVTLSAESALPASWSVAFTAYQWDIGDATLVSGTLTDQEVTIDAPAGQHWITCTVTDANGKTGTGGVLVAACTKTGDDAPLKILEPPTSDNRDLHGRRMSFALDPKEATLARVPHGGMGLYVEENTVAGEAAPAQCDLMVGWVLRESYLYAPGQASNIVELVGPGHLLSDLPASSQVLQEAATPSEWHEVPVGVCHVGFALWYLLRFHCPPLLELFDLHLAGANWLTTRQTGFKLGGSTVGAQIDELCRIVPANFGSASDGTLALVKKPEYEVGSRTGIVERAELSPSVWSKFETRREDRNRVGLVYADGFAYPQTPHRAQAPDLTPGQGPGKASLEGMICFSGEWLEWLAGMHFAAANNPYPEVTIALAGHWDVFEPVAQQFVPVTVPSAMLDTETAEGQAWLRFFGLNEPAGDATLRLIPGSVAVSHAPSHKTVTLTARAETYGERGVRLPIPKPVDPYKFDDAVGAIGDFPGYEFEPWEPPLDTLGVETPAPPPVALDIPETNPVWPGYEIPNSWPIAIAVMTTSAKRQGAHPRLLRWIEIVEGQETQPVWEFCDGGLPTDGSEGAGGGFTYDPLTGIAYHANGLGLWKCTDLFGDSPSWTQVSSDALWTSLYKLIPSYITEGFLVGLTSDQKIVYSTDYGVTVDQLDVGTFQPWNIELVQGKVSAGLVAYADGGPSTNPFEKWNHVMVKITDDFGTVGEQISMPGSAGVAHIEIPARLSASEWNTDGEQVRVCVGYANEGPEQRFEYTLDGGETWDQEDNIIVSDNPDLDGEPVVFKYWDQVVAASFGNDHLQVGFTTNGLTSREGGVVRSWNHSTEWELTEEYDPLYVTGIKGFVYNGLWHCLYGKNMFRLSSNGFESSQSYIGNLSTLVGYNYNWISQLVVGQWTIAPLA